MKNITAHIKGGQIPNGKVKVSGAKNSATRLLAAALISDEKIILENFPTELVDAKYKIDFIEKSGGSVRVDNINETIEIDSSGLNNSILNEYNYPIRTTYLLAAGLIRKNGIARIPYPGGCKIGNRGYDLHIYVWEALGAKVTEKEDYIEIEAKDGFKKGEINFPITTIGGTENALISASTITGKTTIKNAYISPEVEDLIKFLRTLGAKISVVGNSYIEVYGRNSLKGSIYKVMPDRIEALTWIVYAILAGGNVVVEDVPFQTMEIPFIHLKETGIQLFKNDSSVFINSDCKVNGVIQPFEIATGSHPGIISDMQSFFVLLGLYADGISRVYDYRYPERIKYCAELNKMFPDQLKWELGQITTYGQRKSCPKGALVQSTDLRGSMALVISALLSKGDTEVRNVEMALRGYNKLEKKLLSLGVEIEIKN